MTLSRPQAEIYNSVASVNLFLAGQGSGKTFLAGLIAYRFARHFPNTFGFIGANTHAQLGDSTLVAIWKAWSLIGVKEYSPTTPDGQFVRQYRASLDGEDHFGEMTAFAVDVSRGRVFVGTASGLYSASLPSLE